tara:strand:- start:1125 stop:1700 length:576 start_codon:yes stop_codon:yes gene_type:complete
MAKKVKETKATVSPTQSSKGNPKRPKPKAPEIKADKTRVEKFQIQPTTDPMANTPEKSMTEVIVGGAKDIIKNIGRRAIGIPVVKEAVEKAKENTPSKPKFGDQVKYDSEGYAINPPSAKFGEDGKLHTLGDGTIRLPEIEVTPNKPGKLKPNKPISKMGKMVEKAHNDKNVIENNRREDDGSLEYLENKH